MVIAKAWKYNGESVGLNELQKVILCGESNRDGKETHPRSNIGGMEENVWDGDALRGLQMVWPGEIAIICFVWHPSQF